MLGLIITFVLLALGIGLSFITSDAIFLVIVMFLIGLGLIIKGGDIFVDAASWIAEKSGIPKFIIGATIVSVATTLPELVASTVGTIQGSLGLAVGNAIGSVTANTGMIMAISIIFMPAVVKRKDYAFKSILLMIVTTILMVLLLDGKLNIWNAIIVLVFFVAFIWENIVSAKAAANVEAGGEIALGGSDNNGVELEQLENIKEPLDKKELVINILKFILGAAGIYFGAKYLVDSSTVLATSLGVSEDVIGLTLVAIGTSLPELVTTITAIVKKQSALSVGNVIGANIIDMAIILPICALISNGGTLVLDSMQTAYLDIPVSLAILAICLIPMLISQKFKRWQGIVALMIYITYLVIITTGLITF